MVTLSKADFVLVRETAKVFRSKARYGISLVGIVATSGETPWTLDAPRKVPTPGRTRRRLDYVAH